MRVTRLPLRLARRSVGGLGSSSDGGNGGPSWAQPASSKQSAVGAMNFSRFTFMRNKKEYQRQRRRGRVARADTLWLLPQLSAIRRSPRVRKGGSRKRIAGLSFNTHVAGENRNVVLGLCNGWAGHVVVDPSPISAAPQVKALGRT